MLSQFSHPDNGNLVKVQPTREKKLTATWRGYVLGPTNRSLHDRSEQHHRRVTDCPFSVLKATHRRHKSLHHKIAEWGLKKQVQPICRWSPNDMMVYFQATRRAFSVGRASKGAVVEHKHNKKGGKKKISRHQRSRQNYLEFQQHLRGEKCNCSIPVDALAVKIPEVRQHLGGEMHLLNTCRCICRLVCQSKHTI